MVIAALFRGGARSASRAGEKRSKPLMRTTSPALVDRYVTLMVEYDQPEHRPVLDRLLRRFGPVDEEVHHG